MKFNFLIILLFVSCYLHGQTTDSKIYEGVLNYYFRSGTDTIYDPQNNISEIITISKPKIVLVSKTLELERESIPDDLLVLNWNNINPEIISNMIFNNRITNSIDSLPGFYGFITSLSDESYKMIFNEFGWNGYYAIYGHQPLVILTRPGYDENRNSALIYICISYGPKQGKGLFFYLLNTEGNWKVINMASIWES